MARLFLFIGKSSTGKNSIYNILLSRDDLALKKVVPYTTRPIRIAEKDGEDYIFCDIEKRRQFETDGKIIELRSYHTVHGDWEYFTVDDGQIDWDGNDLAMIGTLESYEKLKEYYNSKEIVPIYIEVEDGDRLERALRRERKQEQPKYEEMCRRFLADSDDFSEEKLNKAGITKRFLNVDKEETVENIANYIKGYNNGY